MHTENPYIEGLISRMSRAQKIGALLTLGFAGSIPGPHIYEYIEKYHCGGLRLSCDMRTFGSYVDPHAKKTVISVESDNGVKYKGGAPVPTASEYKQVLGDLQAAARRRPLGLPLHFAYDQEGGTSADFCFGGVNIFPKPMGIRATNDPKIAYQVALAVAQQSLAVGFNWVHSPVLDINTDPRNPEIYTRAYSDNVEDVVTYAAESCRGFKESGMITTGKHFPGRGESAADAHFKVPVIDVDKQTLLERELLPYRILIEQDLLPSIMVAHSIFPAYDSENIATVSKKILTGLLREEMGFNGVITTDSMTMGAVATRYGVANACAMALEAGADLVLMKAETELVPQTIAMIESYIEQGRISENELNNKVRRVLTLKYTYGLFDEATADGTTPEAIIKSPNIRALAKNVARRSVLVMRNRQALLPLQPESKVTVIEQKVKNYNDFQWHSGILFENCRQHGGANVSYLETAYTYDEADQAKIKATATGSDILIVTNYYIRGALCNTAFWQEYIKQNPNKQIIFVTNTPYTELSVPEEAQNVLVSFATSPENIRVSAGVLYGTITPEGVWPLAAPMEG